MRAWAFEELLFTLSDIFVDISTDNIFEVEQLVELVARATDVEFMGGIFEDGSQSDLYLS